MASRAECSPGFQGYTEAQKKKLHDNLRENQHATLALEFDIPLLTPILPNSVCTVDSGLPPLLKRKPRTDGTVLLKVCISGSKGSGKASRDAVEGTNYRETGDGIDVEAES